MEGLLRVEAVHGRAIKDLEDGLADLSQRVQRLENREDIVVNEAKANARAGAQEVMQGVVADLARRIGVLEASGQRTPRQRRAKLDEIEKD